MITRAKSSRREMAAPPKKKKQRSPSSYSGSGTDARDPQPIEDVLQRWVRDNGLEAEIGAGGLTALWEEIVGADIAAHVIPDGVSDSDRGRELLLRADSTAWATQVNLLSGQILGRIRTTLGADVVDRIKVVGPAPPRRSPGQRRVPGPGPRDTYG